MVFSSISFIFLLLPFFLLADFGAKLTFGTRLRNALLLTFSILFYAWGEPLAVFLLIALGAINYGAGLLISKKQERAWRITALFITLNILVLIGFKYSTWLLSFILPSFADKKTSIPLGISFFTFHAISYLIDVARQAIRPAKSTLDFLTYFCMFPHLVAGPIVRYAQVQEDLLQRGPNRNLFTFGLYRFLLGLNKKVLIANTVAPLADAAFHLSQANHLGFYDAWIGIIAYSMQIYFDFSAYSDMAIGLAAMAGFHFEENFQRPYSSRSMQDFWRRWHISLSSWLRDYLYIPLGGSRYGTLATYRNLLIVFLLCGLWHGANMTFIIWGLWHGAFLIIERLPLGKKLACMPHLFGRAYAFLAVTIGWVFFRADTAQFACQYIQDLFSFDMHASVALSYYTLACATLGIAILLCAIPDRWLPNVTSRNSEQVSTTFYILQAILAIGSVSMLLVGMRNPFIYFNF
ncbi:MAG: MBOAT family O-acyltransferase [Pseudomonadota bacterium]